MRPFFLTAYRSLGRVQVPAIRRKRLAIALARAVVPVPYVPTAVRSRTAPALAVTPVERLPSSGATAEERPTDGRVGPSPRVGPDVRRTGSSALAAAGARLPVEAAPATRVVLRTGLTPCSAAKTALPCVGRASHVRPLAGLVPQDGLATV